MQILSDILQKEHVLITVDAKATSFEILRAILLYKELEAKSLKPLFYVHGVPTPSLSAAIGAEKIPVQKSIVKEMPFVIEIKRGSSKIKSVKVDKVGDKLKLFLVPSKGMLPRDLVDVVGVNLPYSHIMGFGSPAYLDELFEGVSYKKISAIREYGRMEFATVSLNDFADLLARASQMSLSGYMKRLVDLNTYNDFIEFFLTGEGDVDLLKVREALINNVLSWGRKDYVQALANWQKESDFIVGIVRVEESNFVPSMPMWADFVFLAEQGIRYPVVTLVQFGKYLYIRVVSPVKLPLGLQSLGIWVKGHIAEGIVISGQVEELKNKVLALLKEAGIKGQPVAEEEPTRVLNTKQPVYDALRDINSSLGQEQIDNVDKGTTIWTQEQQEQTNRGGNNVERGEGALTQSTNRVGVQSINVQTTDTQPAAALKVDSQAGQDLVKGANQEPKVEGVDIQVSEEPLELGELVAKLASSKQEAVAINQGGQEISGISQSVSDVATKDIKDNMAHNDEPALQVDNNITTKEQKELNDNTDLELEELADKIRKTLDL